MIPENIIRSARTARNLTQADLAALSGVSEKTIRRIETGGRIRADNLRALCAALGLNADGFGYRETWGDNPLTRLSVTAARPG